MIYIVILTDYLNDQLVGNGLLMYTDTLSRGDSRFDSLYIIDNKPLDNSNINDIT